MATAFEDVLNAVHGALSAAPAIADSVLLLRERPAALQHDKEIAITWQRASGEQFAITAGPMDWSMPIGIALRVRATAVATLLEQLGALFQAAWSRLQAIAWPGGVMGQLDADIAVDLGDAGDQVAELQLALTVTFRTQAGTLALAT